MIANTTGRLANFFANVIVPHYDSQRLGNVRFPSSFWVLQHPRASASLVHQIQYSFCMADFIFFVSRRMETTEHSYTHRLHKYKAFGFKQIYMSGSTTAFKVFDTFKINAGAIIDEYLPAQRDIVKLIDTFEIADMPNILIHGRKGFPLDVLWEEGFKRKFKLPSGQQLRRVPEMHGKTVPYNDCHFLIEIDLHHPDLSKEIVHVSDFIKSIVQTHCLHMPRHIFVLKNAEMLYNEFSFRIILERYSHNALFVCTTHQVIIGSPIGSRFMHLRVPLPSPDIVNNIVKRCGGTLPPGVKTRDLIRALFIGSIDATTMKATGFNYDYNYPPLPSEFVAHPSIETLRELAYKICQYNISLSDATIDLIAELKKRKRPYEYIYQFIRNAADIDHRFALSKKGKEPIYMEALLHAAAYGNCF